MVLRSSDRVVKDREERDKAAALRFAAVVRGIVEKRLSPGSNRMELEASASIEARASHPELAAAWNRAHGAMHSASARIGPEAGVFQDACAIALGRTACDASSLDPRGVELCKAAGILGADELRKLGGSGHGRRLEKALGDADRFAKGDQTSRPRGLFGYWQDLTVWDGDNRRVTGGDRDGLLDAWRAGRLPAGFRVTFGDAVATPSMVQWDGFEQRHGFAR